MAAISWGRPPALAAAKEDGGGPGLLAALMAPRGFDGAFVPANVGASVIARYEGGRTVCGEAGDGAKSAVLITAEGSGVGEVIEPSDGSGEAGVSGGDTMTVVR